MLEWIKNNVFDYGSFVEWLGLLAAALVLVSFLMKDERTIRIVNIVGAVVFVVYGILIKSASVWVMNFALVAVHIVRLVKLCKQKGLAIDDAEQHGVPAAQTDGATSVFDKDDESDDK